MPLISIIDLGGATPDFGFTVLCDLAPAALVSGRARRYRARLLADAVEVPISDFTYSEPAGRLGGALSLTLATPNPALVSTAALLEFQIGIWTGEDYAFITLLAGGRLSGREHTIQLIEGLPGDEVRVSIVDLIGDRLNLAPRASILLYDPLKLPAPQLSDAEAVRREDGSKILPVATPVAGLTVREVLRRAYVVGCGFAAVITNIEDFPVARAEFGTGGYHAGAAPLVALFEPLYFERDNKLYIIDPDAPLPAGLAPRDIYLSDVTSLTAALETFEPTDAVIVQFRDEDTGDFYTERLDQPDDEESGTFGADDYTRTETTIKVREYRTLSEPDVIAREVVTQTTRTVLNSALDITHRERQQDTLDSRGRKVGHTRAVETRVPQLPDGTLILQEVERETQSVTYRPNPREPRADYQEKVITQVRGLIHADNENTYRGEPFRLPLTDAHRNGVVDPDADQAVQFGPIRKKEESLVVSATGQVEMRVVEHDQIANVTARSVSEPRVGEASLRESGRAHRVLLTRAGAETSGRRIPSIDVGEMPRRLAIRFGKLWLARQADPPNALTGEMFHVDPLSARGATVRAHGRSAALGDFILRGRTIAGRALGTAEQEYLMAIDGRELTA